MSASEAAAGEEDGGEPEDEGEEEEEEEEDDADAETAPGGRKVRGGRKARGRPRLTDSDRVRRRLESRKKYDERRVYLGEAHGPWVELRQRSGWSDAKLAAYLLELERGGQRAGRRGKPWEQIPYEPQRKKTLLKFVVANGAGAGSSESSEESSNSETGEQLENQTDKRQVQQSSAKAEGEKASGLITQDGIHIPFENLREEQGASTCHNPPLNGPETMETVVCMPVPMQVGPGHGALFGNVGEVVASCPVQGSQVIIIAGPGYDTLTAEGIQLNVASAGEEELPCAMIEGVATYTQAQPENGQQSSMENMEYIKTKKENKAFFKLKKEEHHPPSETEASCDTKPTHESREQEPEPGPEEDPVGNNVSSIIYEIPKEPEKRRRSKRSRVIDADGMLEMFHCPYEGCTQVYVALSSFQRDEALLKLLRYWGVITEPSKHFVANSQQDCKEHVENKRRILTTKDLGRLKREAARNPLVLQCCHIPELQPTQSAQRYTVLSAQRDGQGVREFTCETCGKSFKRKNHLEVHRRTHTGETPLQCEICGYQCRQRSSLNWHMKKHTSEVQYNFTCEHCGKRFEKLDSVKFHKLKSHPDHKAA
ncbi:PREDICTED: zinc finger protein 653-like [Thamnophis sirtalis]|uniref:Zinc finger protein 653-like n=1 Tax=Thamnophis sirtalis TaxID=35019 RepID=A0A6I9YU44_9SAUR|nr:PREDICTED: zinc finger protein 653-like [Thamnophis sirtalis]